MLWSSKLCMLQGRGPLGPQARRTSQTRQPTGPAARSGWVTNPGQAVVLSDTAAATVPEGGRLTLNASKSIAALSAGQMIGQFTGTWAGAGVLALRTRLMKPPGD